MHSASDILLMDALDYPTETVFRAGKEFIQNKVIEEKGSIEFTKPIPISGESYWYTGSGNQRCLYKLGFSDDFLRAYASGTFSGMSVKIDQISITVMIEIIKAIEAKQYL